MEDLFDRADLVDAYLDRCSVAQAHTYLPNHAERRLRALASASAVDLRLVHVNLLRRRAMAPETVLLIFRPKIGAASPDE